jgi:sugar phosphate isomerase/epimerase
MSGPGTTRREFVSLALAGTSVSVLGHGLEHDRTDNMPSRAETEPAVRLGVASYSLRNFSRDYVIQATRDIGTRFVNIKSFHQPYESSTEQLEAGRRAFESAGLQIVGGGTITLAKNDDADIRFYFDYARTSGMPLMVIAPTRETLPRIERFVREYDIKVAVHNHGPEDEHFPGPQDVLPVIRDMDPRVGVCLDVGHTARTGIDVIDAVEMCGERLLDMHMKDLKDLSDRESQSVVGEGAVPVARLFEALTRLNYGGYVNLEYEIDPFDPVPGMKRSFAFMRGVLAGLSVVS